MRSIALLAITAYQRFVSPHKNSCCAYRVYTGNQSCSALGYRAIRLYGVVQGIAVLRKRFVRCSEAYRRHRYFFHSRDHQYGFVDLDYDDSSCESCEPPSVNIPREALKYVDCCDCGDWDNSQKKDRNKEIKYVYIPPQRRQESVEIVFFESDAKLTLNWLPIHAFFGSPQHDWGDTANLNSPYLLWR
jgi:putative component of membrane protein insertase Oxa1/YidC/SpoIIIJ protein YidD